MFHVGVSCKRHVCNAWKLFAKNVYAKNNNNFNFSRTILRIYATSAFFNFFRFVKSNLQFRILFKVYYLPPPPSHIWQIWQIPHKFCVNIAFCMTLDGWTNNMDFQFSQFLKSGNSDYDFFLHIIETWNRVSAFSFM